MPPLRADFAIAAFDFLHAITPFILAAAILRQMLIDDYAIDDDAADIAFAERDAADGAITIFSPAATIFSAMPPLRQLAAAAEDAAITLFMPHTLS